MQLCEDPLHEDPIYILAVLWHNCAHSGMSLSYTVEHGPTTRSGMAFGAI